MMNLKLILLFVVFSTIVLQETSATRWILPRRPRFRRFGHAWIGRLGRDVERDLDLNEDEDYDEPELGRYLNERDIDEVMKILDEDGDNFVSADGFRD